MRRQHALSITSQDVRDRTQTIDSYAGDLDELPVYTANINKNPTFGLRVRTSSETEPLKKEEKVNICPNKFEVLSSRSASHGG